MRRKAARALADLEDERRAREAAAVHVRPLQNELEDVQAQAADAEQRMISIQKAKDSLEIGLTRLAHQTDAPDSFAKLQHQYQSNIGQLEQQLELSDLATSAAASINEHADRQHADICTLSGPKDDSFRNRLLRDLQLADNSQDSMARRSRFLLPPSTPYASPTPENGSLRHRASNHPGIHRDVPLRSRRGFTSPDDVLRHAFDPFAARMDRESVRARFKERDGSWLNERTRTYSLADMVGHDDRFVPPFDGRAATRSSVGRPGSA